MLMKAESRYLKYHCPEIQNRMELPANYQFIQLFTGISINEKGQAIPYNEEKKIVAKEYKIPEIYLYPVFHKPISKCFIIEGAKYESK